jgi:hypothetical protein
LNIAEREKHQDLLTDQPFMYNQSRIEQKKINLDEWKSRLKSGSAM